MDYDNNKESNREIFSRELMKETSSQLKLRNSELETLFENIPGGVHQCHNDKHFTLISMSKSFLNLFGFSRQEVSELFHDKFIEMIYPPDRAFAMAVMTEQLKNGDTVEFEYRVRCKDGRLIWIIDKGKLVKHDNNKETFYCIMIDITDRKIEQDQLRLTLERHRIIIDQATDIIFEWDIVKDSIDFSPNWYKKFGYEPVNKNIRKILPKSDNIHREDKPAFMEIMENTAAGVPYSEAEFRIRDIMGNYKWFRIRVTVQYSQKNRPIKAVGIISDIDLDKKQKQILMEQATQDSLTGLLNKAATKNKIDELLCSSSASIGVMFIIDLDDFKYINDHYGHPCGDAVLSDTAHAISSVFRAADVVGRIGGDEFLVFVAEAKEDRKKIKAQRILDAINCIKPAGGKESLRCSIGIAVAPKDGCDFYNLYRCADIALYHIKNRGKGGYAVYHRNMSDGILPDGTVRSAVGSVIDSDANDANKNYN